MVTRDGAIPVVSHTYAGNRDDVSRFATVLDELTSRHGALFDHHGGGEKGGGGARQQPTVVFDAGQNSAANFAYLTESGRNVNHRSWNSGSGFRSDQRLR